MLPKQLCVYIMTNRPLGTLYIGVTSDLIRRVAQHKSKEIPSFTARYGCDKLVYFEVFDNPEAAIQREKRMKEWKRDWKVALIEQANPQWSDLYESIAN